LFSTGWFQELIRA